MAIEYWDARRAKNRTKALRRRALSPAIRSARLERGRPNSCARDKEAEFDAILAWSCGITADMLAAASRVKHRTSR